MRSKELVPVISFNVQELNAKLVIFSFEGTYWNCVHFLEEHKRFYYSFFHSFILLGIQIIFRSKVFIIFF